MSEINNARFTMAAKYPSQEYPNDTLPLVEIIQWLYIIWRLFRSLYNNVYIMWRLFRGYI